MPNSDPVEEGIALAEPTIGGNAGRYLQECLTSNFVSSIGPFVERFEEAFAGRVGARFAVACSSGTAAIHLALMALDLAPRTEVLVPSLTFVASANPVRYLGATPVLVDSEDETYNMDPQLVIDELDARARAGRPMPGAVEIVHLVGHPAVIEPILMAAERHGIPVVEDASEAVGATYVGGVFDGRHVGTLGRVGCFSFNGNKLITTGGGGMVVTDDPRLARRVRHLSTQARLPGLAYDHDEVGYNYRLSNLAAALGLAQLEQLDSLLAGRRANASTYDVALADLDALRPAPHASWADPSFWLYTARLARDASLDRDGLIAALDRRAIQARPMWTPLHLTQLYRDAPRIGGDVAAAIFRDAVSLPSSSGLDDGRRARVVAALQSALA